MPKENKTYFQEKNAHVHDDASMARLLEQLAESVVLQADVNRRTLSGDITLDSGDDGDEVFQSIDPDGARTVTLSDPPNVGFFIISNRADAAEAITVENSSSSTIETVNQDDVGIFYYDGTAWWGITVAGTVN